MSVQIDGKKFIVALSLDENSLTATQVKEALAKLSREELEAIINDCTIVTTEDRLPTLIECLVTKKDKYIDYCSGRSLLSDVEIKRRLRYEKSYLAQRELRYQLGPDIGEQGKHSQGCKRKRKR